MRYLLPAAALPIFLLAACEVADPAPPPGGYYHNQNRYAPTNTQPLPDPSGAYTPPADTPPLNPTPEPPSQPQRPGDYPTAQRTANANEVISPYPPYKVIDVEGFKSGQLARDPDNKKIFRVP